MSELQHAQADLLILAALTGGPAHGYAIIETIKQRSEGAFDLPEGTVYPALHRLERQKLLASAWSAAPDGRRRRVYELTGAGREALQQRRQEWHRFASTMRAAIGAET